MMTRDDMIEIYTNMKNKTNNDWRMLDILRKHKNEELEQALKEIQEISKNTIKGVSERCIETTPMYGIHKQILQKISEVLDDKAD